MIVRVGSVSLAIFFKNLQVISIQENYFREFSYESSRSKPFSESGGLPLLNVIIIKLSETYFIVKFTRLKKQFLKQHVKIKMFFSYLVLKNHRYGISLIVLNR